MSHHELIGAGGGACARYVFRGELEGRPQAEMLQVLPGVSRRTVALAATLQLPGWFITIQDDLELAAALQAAGATFCRHAHSLTLAPLVVPVHPRPPPSGVTLRAVDGIPGELGAVNVAAYPPGSPDGRHGQTADAALTDLRRIAAGQLLGPLLEPSRLAVRGDRAVGAILVTDHPLDGPWVTELFRRPGEADRGVGAALLDAAIMAASAAGHPRLGLAVTEGNPARALYESRGFRPAGSTLRLLVPGTHPRPRSSSHRSSG